MLIQHDVETWRSDLMVLAEDKIKDPYALSDVLVLLEHVKTEEELDDLADTWGLW